MLLLQCPQAVWAAAWAVCTNTTPRLNKTKIPFDRVKGDFLYSTLYFFTGKAEPSAYRVQQEIAPLLNANGEPALVAQDILPKFNKRLAASFNVARVGVSQPLLFSWIQYPTEQENVLRL
mgnify:CR=1 FL=1